MKRLLYTCLVTLLMVAGLEAQSVPLNQSLPLWVTTYNPTTHMKTNADSTPSCSFFIGSSNTAAYTLNMTNVATGVYRAAASLTVANGLAVGTAYIPRCSATVSSLAGDHYFPQIRVLAAESATGYPATTVTTNNDKTGYALTQAFPSNFAALAVDVSGRTQIQYGTSAGQISCAAGICTVIAGSLGTQAKADVNAEVAASLAVRYATLFQWPMQFVDDSDGVTPISGVTPTCVRGLDSISSFGNTTNAASATTAAGWSEIVISAADTTAADYMVLHCQAPGAYDYWTVFKIQTP